MNCNGIFFSWKNDICEISRIETKEEDKLLDLDLGLHLEDPGIREYNRSLISVSRLDE